LRRALADEAGHPLSDLQMLPTKPLVGPKSKATPKTTVRSPSNIVLVRNRMMHARAALNKHGGVRFGLRHIREQPRLVIHSLLTVQTSSTDIHYQALERLRTSTERVF
jgi:hypothetical protein